MDVRLASAKDYHRHETPLLVVPVHDEKGKAVPELPRALSSLLDDVRDDLRGRIGHVIVVNTGLAQGPKRVAFVGIIPSRHQQKFRLIGSKYW